MSCRNISVHSLEDWYSATLWLKDRANTSADVEDRVREILTAVKTKGDQALIDYTTTFDCESFAPPIQLSEYDISVAAAGISSEDLSLIHI